MASHRILALLFLLALGQLALGQNSISFSFTVAGQDTTTSAAVLDQNGIMVKTLWGNTVYAPGTYTASWDGSYDIAATSTPGQNYTIKLLMNNVIYTYDGHFGTTDLDWYGANKYSEYCGWQQGLPKMAFAANRGWVACGYLEVSYNMLVFDRNRPNYPYLPNPSLKAAQGKLPHETDDIATDNQWIYLMERATSGGPVACEKNFVTALDANSGVPVFFSQGTYDTSALQCVWFNPYIPSTSIDITTYNANTTISNPGTGIAVQRSGNILAVAHAYTGVINLYDKKTGASLGTPVSVGVPTINPYMTPLQFTSEGLWYAAGGQLYLITGLPSSPVITQPIAGLSYAVAIGSNTKTNVLYVADGGTNQQIYGYAANTHAKVRTYGTLGGYNDCNPTITHDRLDLDDTATIGVNSTSNFFHYSFVQADDDDNLWIEDMAGNRIQHISPSNNYVEQILYRRPNYIPTVSETMPTRLFLGWMEYSIDYTKTNVPGDGDPAVGGSGAWVMSKNWKVCALGAHGSTPNGNQDTYYFTSVERLSNGKVYAFTSYHPSIANPTIFQLPEDGTPARNTLVVMPRVWRMLRNGDITVSSSTPATPPNTVVNIQKYILQGFDVNSNPLYSALTNVATTTTNSTNSLLLVGGGGYNQGVDASSGGYYTVLRSGVYNPPVANYPHLAGFKVGSPTYLWTTAPEKCMSAADMKGHFPCTGGASSDAIANVNAEGTNLFFLWAGNYVAWGAQFYHYYEDGLMIGQFGNTQSFPATGSFTPVAPGNFGNTQGYSTTTYNGDIYVYVGDEAFAPAHRWHISNLSSVHEYSGTTTLQPNAAVSLTKLF